MDKQELTKIIHNILWMIFDRVFVIVMGLFVTLRVVNYYQMYDYGVYQYALSVIAILEMGTFFVDARVVKKMYLAYDNSDVVFSVTILRLLITFCIMLVSVVCAFLMNTDRLFIIIFVLLLLNLNVNQLKFGITNYLEYNLESKIITIVSSIVLFIGYLFQLYIVKLCLPIVYICLVSILVTIVNCIILFNIFFKKYNSCINLFVGINKELLKIVFLESLPLALAAICAGIYAHCDVLMIGGLMSMREVAVYGLAVKLVNTLQLPLNPIRESLYPLFVKRYGDNIKAFYNLYLKISSILTWLVIVGVLLSYCALSIVFKFVNTSYADSLYVYIILSFSVIFIYNASLRSSYVTIINKGKILMISQIISVFVNIVLNVFLIMCIGMFGAAISTVLTQFLSLFVSNVFFGEEGKRIFSIQFKAFNPIYIIRKN